MKTRFVLKSPADLRQELLNPGGIKSPTRPETTVPLVACEEQRHAAEFAASIQARAVAPLRTMQAWPRGGINE